MKDLCTPDKRNVSFNITLDGLRNSLNEVTTSDKVPEKIKKMTELMQKVYLYSYYEYDFYTLAMIYLSLMNETAIKERFLMALPNDIEFKRRDATIIIRKNYYIVYDYLRKRWKISKFETVDQTLISIVKWHKDKAILPDRFSESDIKTIIYIRNSSAHLENKDIYPPAIAMQLYWRTIDFINCLFDPSVHNNEPTILKETREQYKNVIQQAIDIMERKQNSETDKEYQGGK